MIINLLGPPGVGKSTFASRFVLEHPYYTYCSIDTYRVTHYRLDRSHEENELFTWRQFYKDIKAAPDVVVESVGTDHRLAKIYNKLQDRPRFNIALVGDANLIERRLRERQQTKRLPFDYRLEDEIESVWYVLDELSKDKQNNTFELDITGKDPGEIYRLVTAHITNFRMAHPGTWERISRTVQEGVKNEY